MRINGAALILVLSAGLTMAAFQNCSPVKFEQQAKDTTQGDFSSENPPDDPDVKCIHNGQIFQVGETTQINCSAPQTGTITLTCMSSGSMQQTSNNCELEPVRCNYNGQQYEVGQTRTGPCAENETGQVTYTCKSTGAFAETARSCVRIRCEHNGQTYEIGQTRTENCSTTQTGQIIYTCQANGSFSATSSTCTDTKCRYQNVDYSVGQTRTENCPVGETGQIVYTCQSNGLFTENRQCLPIECTHQGVKYTIGATRTENCATNQTGQKVYQCQNDGNWSNPITNTCTDIQCNVNGTLYNVGAEWAEPCPVTGQTGEIRYVCAANGQPSLMSNTCQAAACPAGQTFDPVKGKCVALTYQCESYQALSATDALITVPAKSNVCYYIKLVSETGQNAGSLLTNLVTADHDREVGGSYPYTRNPYLMGTKTLKFRLEGPSSRSVILAGDNKGTKQIRVDNFFLVEMTTASQFIHWGAGTKDSRRKDTGVVDIKNPLTNAWQPLDFTNFGSGGIASVSVMDLTSKTPIGMQVQFTGTAVNAGATPYTSDVYLVFK